MNRKNRTYLLPVLACVLLAAFTSCFDDSPSGPATPALAINSPGPDTIWRAGWYYDITWYADRRGSPTVKLVLQKDGTTASVIAEALANLGTYRWKIPPMLAAGSGYTISVTCTDHAEITDTSGVFSLQNINDRYEPDDQEIIANDLFIDSAGQTHTLSYPGDVDWFRLSASAGRTYLIDTRSVIDKSVTLFTQNGRLPADPRAPATSLLWTCPASGVFYFSVSSRDTSSYYYRDTLPYDVAVKHADSLIWVINPKAGATDTAGTTLFIQWLASSNISSVTLQLLLDGAPIATVSGIWNTSGNYTLKLPVTLRTSNDYQVRVIDEANSRIAVISEPFTILGREYSLAITAPTGASHWRTGDTALIFWKSTGLGSESYSSYLDLAVYDNGQNIKTLSSYLSIDDTVFRWIIPWGLPSSPAYQIKLTYKNDTSLSCFSEPFSITPAPSVIRVTLPDSSFCATNDSMIYLSWRCAGEPITVVDIDLCDSTDAILPIRHGAGATGGYLYWLIPSTVTTGSYRIRIREQSDSTICGYGAYFRITKVPTFITVVSPADGQTFSGICRVAWTITGPVGNEMGVAYWADTGMIRMMTYGQTFVGDAGSIDCAIPVIYPKGDRYRVKLISRSDTTIQAMSGYFSIEPVPKSIRFTYPPADTTFIAGKMTMAGWTSTGLVDGGYSSEYAFSLELFDSVTLISVLFPRLQHSTTGASWTISSTMPSKSTYRYKLTSLIFPDVFGFSPFFRIVGN